MSRKKAPEGSDNNCSTLTQDTILFSPSPLKAKTQQETQKAVMLSPFPIKLSKPLDIIGPRLSCSPRPTPRSVSSTHQGSPLLPLGPYSAPTNILVNENFTMGGSQISPSLSQKVRPWNASSIGSYGSLQSSFLCQEIHFRPVNFVIPFNFKAMYSMLPLMGQNLKVFLKNIEGCGLCPNCT